MTWCDMAELCDACGGELDIGQIGSCACCRERNSESRLKKLVGDDYQVVAFKDLPLHYQMAIAQYPDWDGASKDELMAILPEYIRENGEDKWGVKTLPVDAVKTAVMADEDIASSHPTWEAYAEAYCDDDVPHYGSEDRWPVILSGDDYETIYDGWHRMHSYVRSGHADIPAVFWPPKR